ncbi:MAG: prepilin peptidase [Bacillota bacterium]
MLQSLPNIILLLIIALINGDVLYYYLKELLNGETNIPLIDISIKNKDYWFIKIYSIFALYLSAYFYSDQWYIYYIFFSAALIIFYVDFLERIIPNELVLALFFIMPLYQYMNKGLTIHVLWGVIPSLSFLIMAIIIPGSMGMGDIKLFFVLGLFFSIFDMFYIVMASSLIAIGFYLFEFLVLREGKDHTLAFGPYIMLSIFIISVF